MSPAKTHWCEKCLALVEPTRHDVTESSEWNGETTWEAMIELRCPDCARIVVADESTPKQRRAWDAFVSARTAWMNSAGAQL